MRVLQLFALLCSIYIFIWGYKGYVSIIWPSIGMVVGPVYIWLKHGWVWAITFAVLHSWVLGGLLFHGTYKFAAPLFATVVNLLSRIKMLFGYGFLFTDRIIQS